MNDYDFTALLMRAFLPVSGHAMFGVMMGYHFGRAKFSSDRTSRHLAMALWLPFFWHGVFDYTLFVSKNYWVWFMIPLMTFLWLRSLLKVKRANAKSPLRMATREERVKI